MISYFKNNNSINLIFLSMYVLYSKSSLCQKMLAQVVHGKEGHRSPLPSRTSETSEIFGIFSSPAPTSASPFPALDHPVRELAQTPSSAPWRDLAGAFGAMREKAWAIWDFRRLPEGAQCSPQAFSKSSLPQRCSQRWTDKPNTDLCLDASQDLLHPSSLGLCLRWAPVDKSQGLGVWPWHHGRWLVSCSHPVLCPMEAVRQDSLTGYRFPFWPPSSIFLCLPWRNLVHSGQRLNSECGPGSEPLQSLRFLEETDQNPALSFTFLKSWAQMFSLPCRNTKGTFHCSHIFFRTFAPK